ncbi:uncharacterized protein I303_100081 [Kwoniella dejecticola CBS 10117]|uniref:Ig-like domain-containing protein n=1 Tax=Kwoniella dejecticola CBS 10117 TaxID=1296121 RepID=A0A1A6ADY1_9TREE|nr:uncharacterized protein I303_00081 [Kwoniella dejecticola CBS 10117]OBR88270.1 hypothetical protein I303_00081 [Kwoniella dejecticola CBS 10117]
MSVTLQAFVLAIALASVSAQDTVNSESGLTYACSKDPSAIPAFINNLCPSSVTSRQGTTWGLRGSRVQAVYINAPTDYHSTQPSDILVSCSWSEPDNDGVFYECEYTAGTGGLVKVTSSNAGGPDSSGQTCPTIAATKPQPSPGTDYRKRQTSAPKFACASTQVGGDNYLVLAARSTFTAEYLDSESTCE